MPTYSGPGFVTSGATPLLQAKNLTFKHDPKNKDVDTLLLGYAGHSPGPAQVSGSVSNAVPAGGPEIDWIAVSAAQAEVPLGFSIAGTTYNCIVNVSGAEYSSGVDNANELSFNYTGRLVNIV